MRATLGISAADHRMGAERMLTCRHHRPNICGCYARPTRPASFICFDCPVYVPNMSDESESAAGISSPEPACSVVSRYCTGNDVRLVQRKDPISDFRQPVWLDMVYACHGCRTTVLQGAFRYPPNVGTEFPERSGGKLQ